MQTRLAVLVLLLTLICVKANSSLELILSLIRTDHSDSARIVLENYNEQNLFTPATYLGGVLELNGKEAFKKFKSLEQTTLGSQKKGQAFFEIAHYYYIT